MKQMWSGNDNDAVESPLARLESLHRDPLYMVGMYTDPNDVFNLSKTNKRFTGFFCGTDERAKGFRANYVTLHRYNYKWKTLSEDVLLMWIDSLIENTDWASAYDNCAIRSAAENGYLKVVRLLLNTPDRSIDPAAIDNYAIKAAAFNGHIEVVRLLLNTPDRGIVPAAKNNYAIREAIHYGHVEVVRLLLNTPNRGIDPASNYNYAILEAAENGHVEVLRLLLNTPDRSIDPAALGNFAIREAAVNGHVEVVRVLLDTLNRRIDPAADNNYAIRLAARNGHLEMVQLLLESGRVDPKGIVGNSDINDLIRNYTKSKKRFTSQKYL